MEEQEHSPKIVALLSHIEKILAETPSTSGKGGAGAQTGDQLLFLGSWQVTLPMLILHDPVLSSDAKVLWGLIKSNADPRTICAMPDYKTLRTGVRVNSNNTLRAAIMELRATRLLSIYRRPRTLQGRFSGNLYVLYDEPVSLADALYMDPGYLDFLREARGHARCDLRTLASAILTTLGEQLDHDKDPLAQPASPLEHHADRHHAYQVLGGLNHSPNAVPDDNPFFPGGQAGFAAVAQEYGQDQNLTMEKSYKGPGALYKNHRDQNLTLDQNLTPGSENDPVSESDTGENEGGSGSNNINFINKINYINNKKTTTTTPTPPPAVVTAEDLPVPRWDTPREIPVSGETSPLPPPDFAWPPSLSEAEQAVSALLLETVPPQWRQGVLDELEGRIRWGKAQNDSLRNKVRWLKAVCDEVRRTGILTPSLGEPVRAERAAKQAQAREPEPRSPFEPPKAIDREAGKTALAQLRKETGI